MATRKATINRPTSSSSAATTKQTGKKSTRRAIDVQDVGNDWRSFRPGIVCGGKLTADEVAARSKGATEACLKVLKKSTGYKSWERGEDLAAPATAGGLWPPLKKAFVVVLVVILAVSASVYREKSMAINQVDSPVPKAATNTVAYSDADVIADVVAGAAVAGSTLEESVANADAPPGPLNDRDEGQLPAGLSSQDVLLEVERQEEMRVELQKQLEDLGLEVKIQQTRAMQAKEKEDSMFEALEASTRKVHDLSRDLRTSQQQVELLESKVRLSIRHSEVIKSVDRTLLGLESLLVISSIVAFVRSHKIRTSLMRLRRSFSMAYRRQQRVLASADEVYAAAMKYNAEVEAADVGPRVASAAAVERELNPWDPLLDDLESLIKSNLSDRVDRGASPVQVLQALAAHFAELKRDKVEMEDKVERTCVALETSMSKMRTLEKDINEANMAAEKSAKALQIESAKTEQLSNSLASAEAKASGLEDQVRAAVEEKELLSDQLIKANEELEKLTSYASSLEKAGFPSSSRGNNAVDVAVGDHLRDFSDAMDSAAGCGDRDFGTRGNVIDDIDAIEDVDGQMGEEILGQRLQRIKQLLQDANESPFELLSPNTDAYAGKDAGIAVRNLPVIGAMNISSSDSDDDDVSAQQDASVQRMLDTSTQLSNQVADYLEILDGDASTGVLESLRTKRDAVDAQRKQVEALVHTSQKEARACQALRARRKEVDFLSEKEEIKHGEDELRASDRLFFARKKEKDAMLELQNRQTALRSALEQARREVRAAR